MPSATCKSSSTKSRELASCSPTSTKRAEKKNKVRQQALELVSYYKPRAQATPRDEVAILATAQALLFLEDYPAAVVVLRQGLDIPDDGNIRRYLASVYSAWERSLDQKKTPSGLAVRL